MRLKMAIRLADESLGELYEDAPCGYISSLVDGTIVRANQTFLDWTGYEREELLSCKRLQDLLTVPGKIFYETHYAPLLQMQGFVKEIALDIVCKNRSPLPVFINSTQQRAEGSRPVLIRSIFLDATDRRRYEQELLNARRHLEAEVKSHTVALELEVSERRRAEENLRDLTSKLLKLRDDERRRLARELHDSVGQLLAAMGMNISLVHAEADKLSDRAAHAVSENAECLNQISSEIRTISHLLHPPLLDEAGLASALTWYVEGLAERSGIKVGLELSPEIGRLPQELEVAIFRIVQECLTNVHRHSGSKTATVRVLGSGDSVRVEVEDHGDGIPAEKLEKLRSFGSGVGLRGMEERARELGGTLEITSNEQGTVVGATLPKSKVLE
jgi:PAS domain S-box-containing protein